MSTMNNNPCRFCKANGLDKCADVSITFNLRNDKVCKVWFEEYMKGVSFKSLRDPSCYTRRGRNGLLITGKPLQ